MKLGGYGLKHALQSETKLRMSMAEELGHYMAHFLMQMHVTLE
jgi:hypothetical protein